MQGTFVCAVFLKIQYDRIHTYRIKIHTSERRPACFQVAAPHTVPFRSPRPPAFRSAAPPRPSPFSNPSMGTTDSKATLVADVIRLKSASLSDHDTEPFDRLFELPGSVMVRFPCTRTMI